MRVLHVHSGNLYGGVETMLLTLAQKRARCASMEQEFALCFMGRLSEELADAGARVHILGGVRVRHPLTVWRARRRLRELLRERTFDVCVCHMAWPQAIFGPVVRSCGVPEVFWLHSATNGHHWLERWARFTQPDFAICPSKFVAATLTVMYASVRSEVVYYPVAFVKPLGRNRSEVRAELNTSADAVVIVQASRMEPWKGQDVHLRALGTLRDLRNWVCWMIGGPQRTSELDYFERLKATAEKLGIAERVRFVGQRSDVPTLLASADIYCQPNTGLEGLPIAFSEALYAGLPVVTTRIGGFWEIIDESCGTLVEPADVDGLATALRRLIEDRATRSRLGAAGPARVRKLCDPAQQIRRLEEVFSDIIQRKPTNGGTPQRKLA